MCVCQKVLGSCLFVDCPLCEGVPDMMTVGFVGSPTQDTEFHHAKQRSYTATHIRTLPSRPQHHKSNSNTTTPHITHNCKPHMAPHHAGHTRLLYRHYTVVQRSNGCDHT